MQMQTDANMDGMGWAFGLWVKGGEPEVVSPSRSFGHKKTGKVRQRMKRGKQRASVAEHEQDSEKWDRLGRARSVRDRHPKIYPNWVINI